MGIAVGVAFCEEYDDANARKAPPLCARGRDKEGGLMGTERVDRKLVVLALLIEFFPRVKALERRDCDWLSE